MAENINDIIARTPSGGTAVLPSGEFEGPVLITKPLRLVGSNTTIWAKNGSVVEITASGVSLEGFRAEVTEGGADSVVITAANGARVTDVEVLGRVSGFGAEDGLFMFPPAISLGDFAADSLNTFKMTVDLPTSAEIVCDTAGLKFSPSSVPAGRSEILITVSGISPKTYLYAEILLKSKFTRRVYLMGRSLGDVSAVSGKEVYTAPERLTTELPDIAEQSAPAPVSQTPEAAPQSPAPTAAPQKTEASDVVSVAMHAPVISVSPIEMKKGQRVSLGQYVGTRCTVSFTCTKPAGMEIDPYVFLLDEHEHALGDSWLVFFGNERSDNGEAAYFPADGHIELDFDKTDPRVRKIALAYSIYAADAYQNFSRVQMARVSVSAFGSERMSFELEGLSGETTVVALEFYIYKGEWKVCAVGSGFRDGMAKLCNSYGIDVE